MNRCAWVRVSKSPSEEFKIKKNRQENETGDLFISLHVSKLNRSYRKTESKPTNRVRNIFHRD